MKNTFICSLLFMLGAIFNCDAAPNSFVIIAHPSERIQYIDLKQSELIFDENIDIDSKNVLATLIFDDHKMYSIEIVRHLSSCECLYDDKTFYEDSEKKFPKSLVLYFEGHCYEIKLLNRLH